MTARRSFGCITSNKVQNHGAKVEPLFLLTIADALTGHHVAIRAKTVNNFKAVAARARSGPSLSRGMDEENS